MRRAVEFTEGNTGLRGHKSTTRIKLYDAVERGCLLPVDSNPMQIHNAVTCVNQSWKLKFVGLIKRPLAVKSSEMKRMNAS